MHPPSHSDSGADDGRPDRSGAPELGATVDEASRLGIHRITVVAYRDLDDEAAGGSEAHADAVLARWAAAGLDVTMRTVAAPGRPETVERNGYRIVRRGGRNSGVPRIAVAGALRRLPPSDGLVEIWNGLPFCSPLWWRGPRVVVLHHLHDKLWDAFYPRPVNRIGSAVERKIAPHFYRSSPIATLAASGRHDLIDRTALRPDQVHVVHPGVDDRFLVDADGDGTATTKSPTPLILAVGRLTAAKRFDTIIRAVAGLGSELADLDLVIVGEGPERPALEALIEAHGLVDRVHLMGRVPDEQLVSWYRSAWVVASASVSEGWGMTLTEAAACGTPAVASNIVGHREAVAAGAGLLVDSDLDFESSLRKLLTDTAYRPALSREALAARELSWDSTAARLLSLLVADAKRRR